MPEIISVSFKDVGPTYFFDPAGFELEIGDWVIVETARGQAMGKVVTLTKEVPSEKIQEPLKPVMRKAEPGEVEKALEIRSKEGEALKKSAELVAKHELPMKLISAEYNFDGSHLTIYFSAEGKVDFRALLKELGSVFKTRVELRQIGARDAAKILGGVGKCGRALCCLTFLTKFTPISVRMARDQSLPLNPTTISGACGKLLCCLKYEHEQYIEMKQRQPAIGTEVMTSRGAGIITNLNRLKDTVVVKLDSESIAEFATSDIEEVKGKNRGNAKK